MDRAFWAVSRLADSLFCEAEPAVSAGADARYHPSTLEPRIMEPALEPLEPLEPLNEAGPEMPSAPGSSRPAAARTVAPLTPGEGPDAAIAPIILGTADSVASTPDPLTLADSLSLVEELPPIPPPEPPTLA